MASHFDTSNYPTEHPLFDLTYNYKAVPGLMKDEFAGKFGSEFVGLRSKLYSCKVHEAISCNHTMYTIRQRRCALSAIDNKRYILPDLVSTRVKIKTSGDGVQIADVVILALRHCKPM